MPFCKQCAKPIRERKVRSGRPRIFCSPACKQAFYRLRGAVKYRLYRHSDLIDMRGDDFERTVNAILSGEVPYQQVSGDIIQKKVPTGT